MRKMRIRKKKGREVSRREVRVKEIRDDISLMCERIDQLDSLYLSENTIE